MKMDMMRMISTMILIDSFHNTLSALWMDQVFLSWFESVSKMLR